MTPRREDPRAQGEPWAPYEPTADAPGDLARVVHLHRRAGFAATWAEVGRDLKDGPAASVARVLAGTARIGKRSDEFESTSTLLADAAVASGDVHRLRAWWVYRMLESPDPLLERLTLMWHGHFATAFSKVEDLALIRRQNDTLRRLAMVGVARTLESRDELADAIAEYQKIAEKWPNSDEGKSAAKRVERLKTPEAIAFYKKFNAYKARAASTTIGPRGTNRFDMPAGHPDLNGPIMPAPSLTGRGVPIGSVPSAGDLPRDPFQKSAADRKAASKAAEDDTLPDIFPKSDRSGLPFAKDLLDDKPKAASLPK